MIKYVVANVLLVVLWYLIGAFVQPDFNSINWTEGARLLVVMCWISSIVPVNGSISIATDKKAHI